jgi:hypothetical protein
MVSGVRPACRTGRLPRFARNDDGGVV